MGDEILEAILVCLGWCHLSWLSFLKDLSETSKLPLMGATYSPEFKKSVHLSLCQPQGCGGFKKW